MEASSISLIAAASTMLVTLTRLIALSCKSDYQRFSLFVHSRALGSGFERIGGGCAGGVRLSLVVLVKWQSVVIIRVVEAVASCSK
jgi:hypothetical protein